METSGKMNTETNENTESRFFFHLQKFQSQISLNQISNVKCNIENSILLIHYVNNDVKVVFLAKKRGEVVNNQTITNVQSFAFHTKESGLSGCESSQFCVIVKECETWKVQVYSSDDGNIKLLSHADLFSCIADQLEVDSITAAYVLTCNLQNITVVINNILLVTLKQKDGQFVHVVTLNLPVEPVGFNCCQIVDDISVILYLNEDKCLKFCRLCDGEVMSVITLDDLQLDVTVIQTWRLSADFTQLIIVLHTGDVQIFNLESYTSVFPRSTKHVTGTKQTLDTGSSGKGHQQPKTYLDTCHYGDYSWREKLLFLHSGQDRCPSEKLKKSVLSYKDNVHKNKRSGKNYRSSSKVTGFSAKESKRGSLVHPAVAPSIVRAPVGLHGYSVDDLCIDPSVLSLVYTYNDVSVLCQWSMVKQEWIQFRFSHGEKVMLSSLPSMPHMVVTATHVSCIVTDDGMDQEQFVSELMTYGGVGLADSVCHINKWGRCSIPVNTLEVGLKHRQLDTVSYFLKSKENLFSSEHTKPIPPTQSRDSPSWTSQSNHNDNLSQLEPALHLLLQSVRDSMGDKHAQIFGKKVLDITVDFMYGLLLDGLGVAESISDLTEKQSLQTATESLLSHIDEARVCMRQLENSVSVSRSGSTAATSLSNVSVDVASTLSDIDTTDGQTRNSWDQMDIETVIEDGIMKNQIPELQQYLLQLGEYSRADYSTLKSHGVILAVNYIKYGNMKKAKELLIKLGLDTVEKLWQIALKTLDMSLCNSIIEELLSMSALSEEQVAMVTFLKQLNDLYFCRDFEEVKSKHQHVKDSESHQDQRLRTLINSSPVYDLVDSCGNLTDKSGSGSRSGSRSDVDTEPVERRQYSEVMLDWVQGWDLTDRQMIQLDVLLHRPGSDLSSFSKEVIWGYLLSHNMCDVIVAWIHNSFPDNPSGGSIHLNSQSDSSIQLDSQSGSSINVTWPVSHLGRIPAEFVEQLEGCTSYNRQMILKAFAVHGVFNEETLSNFNQLLHQLKEVGGVLQLPHPLHHGNQMSIEQFHIDLIQYCIQHDLPMFLWNYCSLHGLMSDLVPSFSESSSIESWFPVFHQFYSLATQTTHLKSSMYQSSLTDGMTVWGKCTSCVGEFLQSVHTLAALATLMYSPYQLQQVTFVTQQLEAFDGLSSESVERYIAGFPKLHVTLFPASASDSPHTDVSVYQLLTGNAPFDPRKLFGWQTTNNCAGEDAAKEMPYFSNSELVSKFAYSEQLHYTYYLKQGRPSMAFITFLAEEFKNGSPTIPTKRLMVAIGTSLWLGVKNFSQPQISASCVMFQELLGHDSVLLRTYIEVGNEILTHQNNGVTGTMDKRREQTKKNEQDIVSLLLACVQNSRRHSPRVLQSLEAAILSNITRDRLPLSSFECGQRWTIAVLFCHLLQLPITTVFLESCAQTNQWLPFIWFAQLHQYPKEQLLNLLHLFKSVHLQEHLRYVLANADIRSTLGEQQKKTQARKISEKAKDVRSSFFMKIGVLKEKESDLSSSSEDEDTSAILNVISQDTSRDEDSDLLVTYDSSSSDVFGVVFAAQASRSPWRSLLANSIILRNPLFAELAACLSGAVVLPCLCGWLVSMMDVTEHAQFLEHHGKSPWRYNINTLDAILDLFVTQKWGSLLVTGFDIFQQNSPLLPFLQFYAEFTEKKNYNNCRLLLDEFKEAVFQFHHEKSGKLALNVIGDSEWLEHTTYRILQYMLTCSSSVCEVSQLLRILESETITLVFTSEGLDADFHRQSQLMLCVEAGDIRHVNFRALLGQTSDQYVTECQRIMGEMIEKGTFDVARKFGLVAKVTCHHVTIAQMTQQKAKICNTELWSSRAARFKFYTDCADLFKKHALAPEDVLKFFQAEADDTNSCGERASLYKLCIQCIIVGAQSMEDNTMVTQLYRNMWLNRIQQRCEETEVSTNSSVADDMFSDLDPLNEGQGQTHSSKKKELLCIGKMPRSEDKSTNLSDKEVSVLLELFGELLNKGEISECCRVAAEFNMYSQDLAIILTCIRLSVGSLSLEQLSPDMLHLLRTTPGDIHRQSIAAPVALLRNSSTISFLSNIQPTIDSVSEENEERIATMERLLNHCQKGKPTCIRILTAFKISAVLCMGYDEVITSDDYHILRSLLKTNCSARFRLASDFLGTSSLSPEEVAGFLSDAILQSYRVTLGDKTGNQEMFFDPGENFSDFHQIVRLCQEPSLLGNNLVDCVAAMSQGDGPLSDIVLTLQTEVLILAHECYTASCDMEGISNILRAARILTTHLQTNNEFQLMTRLLTGVGRYNEMIYIFDALQQNHQFELLLGKGMEKETKLKTAILDYLKRYHPSDNDTYTMVALKFMMYREIAQLLEDNANKILNKLKGKPIDNTTENQSRLQKVAEFLSEAAESYIKDNCLRHAQLCIRRARLVALQLKHLSSNKQFINLTTKGANLLIAEHPVFTEAYIISEAYKQKDTWALALCNNVIGRGDLKYLQEFRSHLRITPTLIEDAVDRYQQSSDKSPSGPNNVKKLLQFCKDVKIQYRIAKQLNLRDVLITLERGDSKSYIMDFT